MSWHFLQEQEAASWGESSLDGAPSALLNLIPMPEASCLPDRGTESLSHSQSGMMSEPLTVTPGGDESTSFRGGSPAKTSAYVGGGQDLAGNGLDSGEKWRGSWARYDLNSCLWRTAQPLLIGDSEPFLVTWPDWGLMRHGESWAQTKPAWATAENEFGYLPTTRASIWKNRKWWARPKPMGNLEELPSMYPEKFGHLHGQYINPEWLEWWMGWPVMWTDLEPLETAKYQEWFNSHSRHFTAA